MIYDSRESGAALSEIIHEDAAIKKRLEESERKYRNLVHSIAEYVYSVNMVDGHVTSAYHSPRCVDITGYFPEEYLADPDLWSKMIHPDDKEMVLDYFRNSATSQDEKPIEHRIIRKDGSVRWALNHTKTTVTEGGGRIRLDGVVLDITARKEVELALAESEEKYRTLVENADDVILTTGLDGTITSVNNSSLGHSGYSAVEIIGHNISEFVSAPESRRIGDAIREIASGRGRISGIELTLAQKTGEKRIKEFTLQPLTIHGKIIGVQGIGRDITRRKLAEDAILENQRRRTEYEKEIIRAKEKAEESTKLKDKFISLVAHDIRSPFVSMLGLMSLLKDGGLGPLNDKQSSVVTRAVDAGEALLRMVDDLLNLNRLQTGRISPQPRFMDANIVAAGTIARLEHLAARKGIRLANTIPAGARIYADPALFGEVILNFVTNSIKFTNAGGEVAVFIPPARPTTISVKDTGIGMDTKDMANLFRCDVPTSTRGTNGERGTGLGLPLSHEIMLAHGGSIDIESQPGVGSVFHANLPFVEPVVLIVDDDPDERFVFRNRLEVMGAKVCEAANGLEGLSIAVRQQPHLIIADIHMPIMDGFEMIRKLKQDPKTSMIPLIVMTSSASIEKREEVLRLGADDFVTKPVVENEFIPRVRRFIC